MGEWITAISAIIVAALGSPLIIRWYNRYMEKKDKLKSVSTRIQNDSYILEKMYEILYRANADRVFIYQLHPESDPVYMSCTYEVVQAGVSKEIKNLQGLILSEWNSFLLKLKNQGGFMIKDIEKEQDIQLKILLKNKGFKSGCVKSIFNKYGSLKAFIGIDYITNEKTPHVDDEDIQQFLYEQSVHLEKYIGEYKICVKS